MFKLDLLIFRNIYKACKEMGCGLGFGVVEGFWTYFIIIAGCITSMFKRTSK